MKPGSVVREVTERFRVRLAELGVGPEPAHLLVAVSGGCDSMVLLHLLRFRCVDLPIRLTVAHLDHAMRPDSPRDLLWLRGVCRAWDLPLRHHRLPRPPAGEAGARRERYAFLEEAAAEVGADAILTAHQADDQAETVLFRVLRGTGLRGLRGIPERTRRNVLRPLLPFWRAELEAYARASGVRWRSDATNRELHPSRNRIRLRLLREAEESFAPGARRHLVALARHAREADAALERLAAEAEAAAVTPEGESYLLARSTLLGYDSATARRLLRRLLRRFDVTPSEAGTRSALQFITHASSGREFPLSRDVRLRLEFDTVRLERAAAAEADVEAVVPRPARGWEGRARLGGAGYVISARLLPAPMDVPRDGRATVALAAAGLDFPLHVRAWRPGDRVRTSGGTKPLKKLFLEERVPRSLRHRLPVLTDARGRVLWVRGMDRVRASTPSPDEETLLLTIENA